MNKGQAEEEENASELKLGREFEEAKCLMISEVAVVLDLYKQKKLSSEETLNMNFEKFLEYTQRFNRFENAEAVKAVRELLTSQELYEFEVGALGNLVPETAQEARALVPTLSDGRELSDATIDQMMQTLASFKTLQ